VWILWFQVRSIEAFDEWIRLSVVCVGIAHVVLATSCVLLGRRLGEQRDHAAATASGCKVVALTSLAACVPGVILLGIPPVLTAVTGGAFVPLMFALAAKRLAGEHATLASLHA
jgi:hypothetical protein